MRISAIFWFCVLCAGCNAPPFAFRDAAPTTITVGKSSFDVRQQGNRVLALRTNMENATGNHGITGRAMTAIEQASGCQVVPGSVESDTILIYADVSC